MGKKFVDLANLKSNLENFLSEIISPTFATKEGVSKQLGNHTVKSDVPEDAVFTDTKDWESITGKPDSFPASSHGHTVNEITGLQDTLDGKASSDHTHDDRYYTESEIDTKLSGKANTSHGNHVPTTQTADNATFLRNDNTWAKVTPANIGAQPAGSYASASHTHDDRYYTESEINTKLNSKANSSHTHGNGDITSLDASKITSGTISIDRLPQGALERLTVVADDTARFKLTSSTVQKGDTVKVTVTGKMYYVVDETKLSSEAGYEVYAAGTAASVPWSGVTGKPSTYTPSSHTHDDRYYTESEVDSKLGGKVDLSRDGINKAINKLDVGGSTPTDADCYISQYVGGGTTTTTYHRRPMSTLWNYIKSKLATVATSGSYNDLSNKPTIPSVGNGTVTIKQAGASKGTFTMNQSGNTTIELTDNNTWRGIQNNLTSDSTTDSLSAAQGKVLKDLVDGKAANSHTHTELMSKNNPTGTGSFSLNRKADTTVGSYSHAEGQNTTASGQQSHAEGYNTTGSGSGSHAEGANTTASGVDSHAEGTGTTASGYHSHAEGAGTTASSHASHAEGYNTTASGSYSHAEGANTTASNYASHVCGKHNVAMTAGGEEFNIAGTAFVIGNGTSSDRLSNAFSIQYNGTVKAKSTITASTTADYAEFFEWIDKNTDEEDRVGHFVTLDGDKIKIATSEDDYILGIVSGEPFVLGNGDCDTWNGMFLHDEFRRTMYEPAPKIIEILDNEGNPTGEYKEVEGEYEGTRPILNPDYDPTQKYISRFDRAEWSPVGMLGVLAVLHDGTAEVNGYVTVNNEGIATKCTRDARNSYRVIKKVSDKVVEVIFR